MSLNNEQSKHFFYFLLETMFKKNETLANFMINMKNYIISGDLI